MKYNVHIFTGVRVKVTEIEADNHVEAIQRAERQVDFHGLFRCDRPGFGAAETDWAEPQESDCFLVDEVGDKEYTNSRWYQPGDEEIVPLE